MTKVPLCTDLLHKDEASSTLMNQISLLARPYGDNKASFEDRMMEAVLVDQKTICVRDLPAFYACSASLLYKLDEINRRKGLQEERFKQSFQAICQKNQIINDEAPVRDEDPVQN